MIWPFKKKLEIEAQRSEHPAGAIELLNELNGLVKAKPRRGFFETVGPYAKDEPVDPISEASVYLAYGRYEGAASILEEAAASPESATMIGWVDDPAKKLQSLARKARDVASLA
jgi:hypothetical protein